MVKNYRVFISHAWQHSGDLLSLRKLLNERGYFYASFEESSKDEPINSTNAYYVKRRLAEKISNSNIVLALAGIYASHSQWMEWELDKALELAVPIVGVIPRGQLRVSRIVSSRTKDIVRWNTESIVDSIRALAL